MKDAAFRELLTSVRQAGEIRRGRGGHPDNGVSSRRCPGGEGQARRFAGGVCADDRRERGRRCGTGNKGGAPRRGPGPGSSPRGCPQPEGCYRGAAHGARRGIAGRGRARLSKAGSTTSPFRTFMSLRSLKASCTRRARSPLCPTWRGRRSLG